MAGDAPQLCHG